MRATFIAHALLCVLLGVPLVTTQGVDVNSLSQALQATMTALDELARLEAEPAPRQPSQIERIRALTESPLEDAARRDALLEELRRDVAELESRVERGAQASSSPNQSAPLLQRPVGPSIGLSEDMRRALSSVPPVEGASISMLPALKPASSTAVTQAFEQDGYAADPMRLAMTCFRAGNHAKALNVLAGRTDAASRYWRARCLERLGRNDEARKDYQSVIDDPQAGELEARAREELDFLNWRLKLETKTGAATTHPAQDKP